MTVSFRRLSALNPIAMRRLIDTQSHEFQKNSFPYSDRWSRSSTGKDEVHCRGRANRFSPDADQQYAGHCSCCTSVSTHTGHKVISGYNTLLDVPASRCTPIRTTVTK